MKRNEQPRGATAETGRGPANERITMKDLRKSDDWRTCQADVREMTRRAFVRHTTLAIASCCALPSRTFALLSSGSDADNVSARAREGSLLLENGAIRAEWRLDSGGLHAMALRDKRNGTSLGDPVPVFRLSFLDGSAVDSAGLVVTATPRVENLAPVSVASRYSDRVPGKQIVAAFRDLVRNVEVEWRAILREGSHYIRQELVLKAPGGEVPIHEIILVDVEARNSRVAGSVDGSPLVAGEWFLGFEHPLSQSSVENSRARSKLVRRLPLAAGQSIIYSCVIGSAAPGQLRRDFLRYVERERAHPYRPFLHYNSWYDLGYFTPFDEAAALDAIHAFGEELHVKRGVELDSFLFDDGWDDHKLWGFNSGFPHGFTPLKEAATKYGAAPGVWLSPWGGYGNPRKERLAYGAEHGFEQNEDGLALSGPVYYRRFREVCLEMIRKYGVNQFKFDGTGNAARVIPGSQFGSDFEAALRLIADLRAEKLGLFVNVTTGTYPSPFWLMLADSTWRGGEDHDFAGVGTPRQQWITYRDADTYRNVVQRGPLYPLNSLMLHGLIFAKHAKNLANDPGSDFRNEVRSYFGTGTQLQEMYITHSLLSESDWDMLAEACRWSRRNAAALVDTHWIGSNPAALEVYGWACWSGVKGLVTLRNPSDRPQTFEFDLRAALELPEGSGRAFRAVVPWKNSSRGEAISLTAGEHHPIALDPFEVLTLEVTSEARL